MILTSIACLFLVVFVFCPCDGSSDSQQEVCPGTKGESGVPGVPGPPGVRGRTGSEGPPGLGGSKGDKGQGGPEGAVGPPGAQGEQGVMGPAGPPGSQGPPGKTGKMGPPGPRGPPGQAGGRGQKGERGIVGPRGLAGVDGVPGVAGPIGPPGARGEKGVKGNLGIRGAKGERGPQGPVGPELSEDVLKRYFAPVKVLFERITQLENRTQECLSSCGQTVAASCRGSIDTSYTISGVITYWTSNSPSFLIGGVTYSNGVLTVPSDGVYYIYLQLYLATASSGSQSASIRVNGNLISYLYHEVHSASGTDTNQYRGILWQLRKSDRVDAYGNGRRYYMHPQYSFFGLWKVN